ncbi:hypothetical protein M422DRAFT_29455 [Sphaerobolus stellatus SS14]|uniref:Xylanolytic transcriptional activator regulatory domain-containing protein n=1 Tax=Sphaerobolus stellatus (strain SS14) TaxID=990650 RepID=A0A0C9UT98_SPHS4|nr:hypothetical protein M422DRAFT_29455 [Sphaerobolus stellatus SS14]
MAYYHILRDQNAAQDVWAMMGLVAHMAENIGLHRDPRQWKMDDHAVQERRTLFWEIYFLFILESISLGRPPPLPLDYCDCEYPRLDSDNGNIPVSTFAYHKYTFASTILSQITRVTLGVTPISYGTILALDKRIRDHPALILKEEDFDFSGGSSGAQAQMSVGAGRAQMFMGRAIGEMALLYLHRRFFARALSTYPSHILHCPFGPSVLAIFKAASAYIALMKEFCEREVGLAIRFAIFWNNLLASSFVMAAIATRAPSSVLAPSALSDLDTCHALLVTTTNSSGAASRPSRALDIVAKIRIKAHKIVSDFRAGIIPLSSPNPAKASRRAKRPGEEDPNIPDAIDVLSGKTRLLTTRRRTSSTHANPSNAGGGNLNASAERLVSTGKKNDDLARAERIYAVYRQAHPDLVKVLKDATATPIPPPPRENTASALAVPVGPNIVQQIPNIPPPASLSQPQNLSGVTSMMQQGMVLDPQLIAAQAQVQMVPVQATDVFPGQPQPQQNPPLFLDFSQLLQPQIDLLVNSQSPQTALTQPLLTPSLVEDLQHIFAPAWDLSPPASDDSKTFTSPISNSSGYFDFMQNAGMVSAADVGMGMGQGGTPGTAMDADVIWDDFMKEFGMQVDSDGSPPSG